MTEWICCFQDRSLEAISIWEPVYNPRSCHQMHLRLGELDLGTSVLSTGTK